MSCLCKSLNPCIYVRCVSVAQDVRLTRFLVREMGSLRQRLLDAPDSENVYIQQQIKALERKARQETPFQQGE